MSGVSGLLVAATITAASAGTPNADCLPSIQRPATCQLRFDLEHEAVAWSFITLLASAGFVLEATEDNSIRWQRAGSWERSLRRSLEAETPEGRGRARTVADAAAYVLPFSAALVTGVATSIPTMLDGHLPSEGLQDIYTVATAFLFGSQINRVLKVSFGRRRPGARGVDGMASSSAAVHSFPSGHTLAAVGMGSALATTLYLRDMDFWWLAAIAAGVGGVTAGVGRIVSGDHWGGDVVTGALIGAAVGIGYPWLAHPRRSSGVDDGPAVLLLPTVDGAVLTAHF